MENKYLYVILPNRYKSEGDFITIDGIKYVIERVLLQGHDFRYDLKVNHSLIQKTTKIKK